MVVRAVFRAGNLGLVRVSGRFQGDVESSQATGLIRSYALPFPARLQSCVLDPVQLLVAGGLIGVL